MLISPDTQVNNRSSGKDRSFRAMSRRTFLKLTAAALLSGCVSSSQPAKEVVTPEVVDRENTPLPTAVFAGEELKSESQVLDSNPTVIHIENVVVTLSNFDTIFQNPDFTFIGQAMISVEEVIATGEFDGQVVRIEDPNLSIDLHLTDSGPNGNIEIGAYSEEGLIIDGVCHLHLRIGGRVLENEQSLNQILLHELMHLDQQVRIIHMLTELGLEGDSLTIGYLQYLNFLRHPSMPDYRQEYLPNWYEFQAVVAMKKIDPEFFDQNSPQGSTRWSMAMTWEVLFEGTVGGPDYESSEWETWTILVNQVYIQENTLIVPN